MHVDPDRVPTTIQAAVTMLVESANEDDRECVLEHADARTAVIGASYAFGKYLRNSWSLWERDTPLKLDAVQNYGIAHADDISSLILHWVVATLRNDEFVPSVHCERYHAHWQQYGTTALAAGGY